MVQAQALQAGFHNSSASMDFYQLILLDAEMTNTMDSHPRVFAAQGYVWFGCVLLLVLVIGRAHLINGTYLFLGREDSVTLSTLQSC